MKKYSLIILVAVMAIMGGFSSCQKEELASGTFSATMERYASNDSKVVFDSTSHKFSWQLNDLITVYRWTGESNNKVSGDYQATSVDGTRATFVCQSSNDVTTYNNNGVYAAFSPKGIHQYLAVGFSGSVTDVWVKLPAEQTADAGGNLVGFPMYAQSAQANDQHLAFKNLCGLMRLSIVKANTSIDAISVTTDNAINGVFTVNYNSGSPSLSYEASTITDANKTVKLIFAEPQSISTRRDFYIALPASPEGGYSTLEIKIFATDGSVCTMTMQSGSTLQIARNKYTKVDLTDVELEFVTETVPAYFSVGPDTRVRFSPGNLQYQPSTRTWKFADRQYDHVFTSEMENGPIAARYQSSYTGWIDLFGWGTSGHDNKYPYLSESDNQNYGNGAQDIANTDYDWGHYNEIGNDASGTWRTLTKSEWEYLLGEANGSSVSVRTDKWAKATVCGTKGIILLPDEWVAPTGVSLTCGSNSNYSSNTVSTNDDWLVYENAGAVFLPVTGSRMYSTRNGHTGWYIGESSLSSGYYWSSTKGGTTGDNALKKAYCCSFGNTSLSSASSAGRRNGYAVRLVRNVD